LSSLPDAACVLVVWKEDLPLQRTMGAVVSVCEIPVACRVPMVQSPAGIAG
jgi:hypothetical protein